MLYCNNSIVAYSTESTIGFLDLYTYLKQLVDTENATPSEKLSKFNLEVFKNMSKSQLKEKIGSLKQIFESRHTELVEKAKKLQYLQIIDDTELPNAEAELEKINKILDNKNFSGNIKLIQNKLKTNSQTKEDEIKYSFFKELEEQAAYLKNFKIGSMKKYNTNKQDAEKNIAKTKTIMNGLVKDMKQKVEVSLNKKQKVELDELLSVWSERETRRIVQELNRDYDRDMTSSKINLKGKVMNALAKFLNITIVKAGILMKDVNFRVKLFGNINMEDVQNKLNIINNELNEHEMINDYLRTEEQKRIKAAITKLPKIEGEILRDPGFEPMTIDFDDMKTKTTKSSIKKIIKKETLAQKMEKSLKDEYKQLLNKKVFTTEEYKMVEKIIENEIKNTKTTSNVTEIKAIIRVHISRMIIDKYLVEENVFSPLKTLSPVFEKIYETEQELVNIEALFNNIINYKTDKPFDILKESFNNIVTFLKSFGEMNTENVMKTVDNLLYADMGEYTLYKFNAKNKMKKERLQVRDELNTMNLITLLSYTTDNNAYIDDVVEKVVKSVEVSNKSSNMWSWASKEDLPKIVTDLVNKEGYEFVNIADELYEKADEEIILSNTSAELIALSNGFNKEKLNELTKQFNEIYDMFYKMYKLDIIPHNLNKLSGGDFESLKRKYFFGLITGLYMKFLEKLLSLSSTKRFKTLVQKTNNVLSMYLNEEVEEVFQEEVKPEVEEKKVDNKDELLNDFFAEELEQYDVEDEELMEELFGEE